MCENVMLNNAKVPLPTTFVCLNMLHKGLPALHFSHRFDSNSLQRDGFFQVPKILQKQVFYLPKKGEERPYISAKSQTQNSIFHCPLILRNVAEP